jgi:two-component system, NarL family, response regulator LiaR
MSKSAQRPIRVMIADDHLMVRKGLTTFLKVFDDLELAGEAENGIRAVEICAKENPDVVLMDMVMPEMDGQTATQIIHKQFPKVRVIALTSFSDGKMIKGMLQAGAIGYLLKDISADDLANAIRQAHTGKSILSADSMQMLIAENGKGPQPGQDLTARELDVLKFMVKGFSNTRIATELVLSPSTVKSHVSSILSKLHVFSRSEAVALAVREKIIT